MKPIIGVITRPDHLESGNKVDLVYSNIRKAIVRFGGIVLPITPPTEMIYDGRKFEDKPLIEEAKEDLLPLLRICDGFVFQGGDFFYDYDLYIVKYAYEHDIPSLGICLGMQLMAYSRNGILEKRKESNVLHYTKDPYAHEVFIRKNSLLEKILNVTMYQVNSRHYEHIVKTDLKVSATAPDSVIEAVEDPDKRFFVGVQWHPEDSLAYDKVIEKLWSYFLLKCRECADENKGFNCEKWRGYFK